MGRKWIKLWVKESLDGSIRIELTPAERCVWYELLLLAGDCRQDGLISPNGEIPYPERYIASTLVIPRSVFRRALEKLVKTGRVLETPQGLRIANWNKYQADYTKKQEKP